MIEAFFDRGGWIALNILQDARNRVYESHDWHAGVAALDNAIDYNIGAWNPETGLPDTGLVSIAFRSHVDRGYLWRTDQAVRLSVQ